MRTISLPAFAIPNWLAKSLQKTAIEVRLYFDAEAIPTPELQPLLETLNIELGRRHEFRDGQHRLKIRAEIPSIARVEIPLYLPERIALFSLANIAATLDRRQEFEAIREEFNMRGEPNALNWGQEQ